MDLTLRSAECETKLAIIVVGAFVVSLVAFVVTLVVLVAFVVAVVGDRLRRCGRRRRRRGAGAEAGGGGGEGGGGGGGGAEARARLGGGGGGRSLWLRLSVSGRRDDRVLLRRLRPVLGADFEVDARRRDPAVLVGCSQRVRVHAALVAASVVLDLPGQGTIESVFASDTMPGPVKRHGGRFLERPFEARRLVGFHRVRACLDPRLVDGEAPATISRIAGTVGGEGGLVIATGTGGAAVNAGGTVAPGALGRGRVPESAAVRRGLRRRVRREGAKKSRRRGNERLARASRLLSSAAWVSPWLTCADGCAGSARASRDRVSGSRRPWPRSGQAGWPGWKEDVGFGIRTSAHLGTAPAIPPVCSRSAGRGPGRGFPSWDRGLARAGRTRGTRHVAENRHRG